MLNVWNCKTERSTTTLRVSHPFLPQYYGEVQHDNGKFIVIEYIQGKTLNKQKVKNCVWNDDCDWVSS